MNQQSTLPLHRIRFYDHTPSPITCLQFAPLPLPPARDPHSHTTTSNNGNGKEREVKSEGDEFGVLVAARENGAVEIWGYVRGDDDGSMGNWVLSKTLPPILTHPTISQMALVIKDPTNFHLKPYSVPKIDDLRLFTAGSDSGDLIERCLASGRIIQTYTIPSPPLWSLTVSPTHNLLCLTTSSPSLHFLTIPPPLSFSSSPTQLEPAPTHLLRSDTLPSRTRTVSVAFGPPSLVQNNGQWEWQDEYLITGNSDSSYRKWSLPSPSSSSSNPNPASQRVTIVSRSVVERLKTFYGKGGKKMNGTGKGTIIWGCGVLADHTVVTSDSLGSVIFWDGQSGAQKQSFTAHKADGMCLVIGPGGRTVFTSGPDQRVCQFTLVTSPSSPSKWVQTSSKRMHTHDVRSLSIFPPHLAIPSSFHVPINPGISPILASGGWDMNITLTPASAPSIATSGLSGLSNPLGKKGSTRTVFDEAFYRKLPFFKGVAGGGGEGGVVQVARGERLVLGRKDRSVGIWRVLEDEGGWGKVLEMEFKLRTNLIASAISQDGRWLAVSDLYETKLYKLDSKDESKIIPTRIKSFLPTLLSSPLLSHLNQQEKGTGSSSLTFTPDSQRLILGLVNVGEVVVIELPPSGFSLNGHGVSENGNRNEKEEGVRIVKCFSRSTQSGRVVLQMKKPTKIRRPKKRSSTTDQSEAMDLDIPQNGLTNGHSSRTAVVQNGGGVEEDAEDDDEEEEEVRETGGKVKDGWVGGLAVSDDCQWLGVSDLEGQVSVYNLDTLQLHAHLPTLPHAPIQLLFPSSTPLLLILSPTNKIEFYHLEHRRFLPPPPQIVTLNSALREQYATAEGASFEPLPSVPTSSFGSGLGGLGGFGYSTKAMKIVIWSHEWLLTARLDLDIVSKGVKSSPTNDGLTTTKALRKKRAREAKQQLFSSYSHSSSPSTGGIGIIDTHNTISISPSHSISDRHSTPSSTHGSGGGGSHADRIASSALDPEFYKVTEKYKSVVGCFWFGFGELGVVERPMGDYSGELPAAFWSGRFGRS